MLSTLEQEILKFLLSSENKMLSAKQIANHLDMDVLSLKRHLIRLKELKYIKFSTKEIDLDNSLFSVTQLYRTINKWGLGTVQKKS